MLSCAPPEAAPALCWCGRPLRHKGHHLGQKVQAKTEQPAAPPRAPAGRSPKLRAMVEREVASCHAAIVRLKNEIRSRQTELLEVEAALSPLVKLLDAYRDLALPAPERTLVGPSPTGFAVARLPKATEVGRDDAVDADFEPEEVDFHKVRKWAEVRGLVFRTWDDLPKINERREHFELPPFKRRLERR